MNSVTGRTFSFFILILFFDLSYPWKRLNIPYFPIWRRLNIPYFPKTISSWNTITEYDNRPFCITDMDFSNIKDRVVGGSDADKNAFRYASAVISKSNLRGLYRTDMAMCGATLITDRHVITAAHCLYGKGSRLETMALNIGDYDTQRNDDVRNYIREIERVYLHPRYVDETFDNDIAILEFRPVPLGRDLRAVILPPQDTELSPGTITTVVGWGRTSYEGKRSTKLQRVDVPITSTEECQKELVHTITPNMLCAGGVEGEDACLGDSGGSLFVQAENYNVACGIVSFGRRCALKGVSGVYTKLSRFTNWVYEMTRSADCRPRIFNKENYPH